MTVTLEAPDLKSIAPKTITAIGKFSANLFLTRIFDVLPLFETDNFKAMTFKHEGLMREVADGGLAKESDTEFKNSITMEIMDKECEKIRSIKINCGGVHMCGNRSVKRASEMANLVIETIVKTDEFIEFAHRNPWEEIVKHPFYESILPTIQSILPPDIATITDDLKVKVVQFFRNIRESGGLFEKKSDNKTLKLDSLNTVMINFSYNIEEFLRDNFKNSTKEEFLRKFIDSSMEYEKSEFDIFINYDSLTSSMGWSGSIPLKFIHRETNLEQWLTLQMRRGTIVNSGPSFEVMQKAVDTLYEILNRLVS